MGKPKARDLPDLSHLVTQGAFISVRAVPKASRDRLELHADQIRVYVTAAPENGKATEAVRQLLARAMGIAPSQLMLRQGATSRSKIFAYLGEGAG